MSAPSIIASGSSNSGSSATLLIFVVLLGAVMYFTMIRPQRRRLKEQTAMQSSIGIGDEVVTNSGIYGFITGVDGDRFWLEIDDDVQIRIARAAIQGKVPSAVEAKSDSKADSKSDASDDADES